MNNPDTPNKRPRRAEFQQALKSMDTYIDITVDDLMTLAQRAEQLASRRDTETIRITQVMAKPVHCVHPSTSLSEAAHTMVTQKISGLPVVDDNQRLVGIITEADFLKALGVPAHQPHHNLWETLDSLFSHMMHQGDMEAPSDAVTEHMMKNVITADPDSDVHDVIEIMKRNSVKRVVVIDSDRRVLGMVTRSDLVRLFFDKYTQTSA